MSDISKAFKESVIAKIKALPEVYDVSEIEVGDDDVIALAEIGCINGTGTTPILRVSRTKDMLDIEIRRLAFLGPENSVTNLTVTSLFRDLAQMFVGKEDLTRQDRLLHVLALDAFTSRKKTVWELMAMIALEMNNFHLATRSVVDFSDGEVFVDTALDCDFESVPDAFEDRIQSVAGHAKLLEDILRVVRRNISDEPASADECFRGFSKIQRMLKKDSKNGEGNGDAEGEKQEQDAPVAADSSEEDEELTI